MARFDPPPRGNRRGIRERLASTRVGFHTLLDGLTDDDLRRRSGNPARTIDAVLTYLVWSLDLLPREVARARTGKGMFNMPPVPNAWATGLAARGQTLETLRQRYDAAFAAALTTLDGIRVDEFQLGAQFWSEGFRDIAGLCAVRVDHLAEHATTSAGAVPRFTSMTSTTQ